MHQESQFVPVSGLLSHPKIRLRTENDKSHNKGESFRTVVEQLPPLSAAAKRRRILLLEPLYPPSATWGSAKVEQGYLPPIGLISVYAFLKYRGYNVDLIDTQFGDDDETSLGNILKENEYDVIGIPTFTSTADFCFSTAALVRKTLPEAKIVFGNIHASSQPELTFAQCPEVDFIIKHEGEFTFDELLRSLSEGSIPLETIGGLCYMRDGEFIENPPRSLILDLDILPSGFYSDLSLERYVPHPTQYVVLPNYPVVTQRGCPYPCTYCEASVILGKKTRVFSPERVVEELKILVEEKNAKGVYFQDSTFTINKKYTMKLMGLMVREKLPLLWSCNTRADRVDHELLGAMREAGCRQIILGIESGNQESLDVVKKRCTVEKQTEGVRMIHKHKIATVCSYILCLPGETEEMALNTIRYARSLASRIAMFYLPVPYPASELYRAAEKDGGLRQTDNWSEFLAIDYENPVYVNPRIGKEGMQRIYRHAFKSYYMDPRVWYSNLCALTWGMPIGPAFRGLNALSAMLGFNPFQVVKKLYRGFHGQLSPTEDVPKAACEA